MFGEAGSSGGLSSVVAAIISEPDESYTAPDGGKDGGELSLVKASLASGPYGW